MPKWYEGSGREEDVVLSTRVRLARNLRDYNFPKKIDEEGASRLRQEVESAVAKNLDKTYESTLIKDLDKRDRGYLVENHLISPSLIKDDRISSFLLREDELVTIMINEEDHIRIQKLEPGLELEKSWATVNTIDDGLEEELTYAFDEDLGYLTACPTNVGTGLRASAMVHIPSLNMSGYLNSLIHGLNKIGMTVRGIYGEGSEALGDLYQISNQLTLGEEEALIIDKLKGVIYQVIDKEREVRDFLLRNKSLDIEDRVFRSLGIVREARIMSSREAMAHISNIRLGMETGLIDQYSYGQITELIINIQPANIQKLAQEDLEEKDRQISRAKLLRECFKDKEV